MASVFSKRVAIVTGASSGIGEAIALMFASRGANVTMCGQNQERLKSVFDKIVKASGGNKDMFLTVQGDLNDRRVRKAIVDQTLEKFGRLDILIPNAGVTRSKQSVTLATEETYNIIMDTNLKSVFFLIQEAIPHLEKSKGNIISISSAISHSPSPAAAIYSLSKNALDHLSRILAAELGPKGIRTNVINPGFIPTFLLRHHGKKMDLVNSNVKNTEMSLQLLRDKFLTFKDITETVAFLASEETGGFITGESIMLDGGRLYGGLLDWSPKSGSPKSGV